MLLTKLIIRQLPPPSTIDHLNFDSKMAFVTITLRNLDSKENKDVVKILESFMVKRDIKTGQRAIEEIIKEYDYLKNKSQKLSNEIEIMKDENHAVFNAISSEYEKYKKVIDNYKFFMKSLNEL